MPPDDICFNIIQNIGATYLTITVYGIYNSPGFLAHI